VTDLLVGADIGGTSTRVAVASLSDGFLAVATGGVGNPNLIGLDGSAAVIRETLTRALSEVAGTVVSTVVGLAGGTRTMDDSGFLTAALGAEVAGVARVVSDANVAFSSATSAEEGYVVIAGTGAVAGRINGAQVVDRQDGWGWLVGDQGSGFWLGRAAVRSTLLFLDEGRALGPLHADVLATTGAHDTASLVRVCYAEPPIWLARLAPLVSRHADTDPVAGEIANQAAGLLAATLLRVRPVGDRPIVLAGSVLVGSVLVGSGLAASVPADQSPVGRRLRQVIAHLHNPVLEASSGLVGALWLAARQHGVAPAEFHRRLLDTSPGARA
jgi:glucosamine kinase